MSTVALLKLEKRPGISGQLAERRTRTGGNFPNERDEFLKENERRVGSGPVPDQENNASATSPEAPLAKILVIDDQPSIVNIIHVNFELRGFAVYDCVDSSEAQELAGKVQPDVVILDLLMPRKSGWEVLAELKASDETRHIPVIVLSVMTQPDVQEEVRRLGAASFMAKPFDLNALLAEVKKTVGLD